MLNFVFNFSPVFCRFNDNFRLFFSDCRIIIWSCANESCSGRIFHVGFCPRPKLEQLRVKVWTIKAPPADPIVWLNPENLERYFTSGSYNLVMCSMCRSHGRGKIRWLSIFSRALRAPFTPVRYKQDETIIGGRYKNVGSALQSNMRH
jgi:hypothetical protein